MELTSLASNVKLANVGQVSGFTMEANQFSFRVMSDGLYQNKIGSPVREVSCNALDSHVQAGKGDVPIVIHLPDTFEPFFSVRDYGIGLDDTGVRQTFATYFRSTKRESNASIGAFGLGSKTPFAYTDAFTVVAIKDGRKRQYSMFIGETGLPSIANMGGEFSETYTVHSDNGEAAYDMVDEWDVTDEGNGVEVIIPVIATGDFHRFRTEVQNQLAFFDVKPEILNGEVDWMDWSDAGSYLNLDRILIGSNNYSSRFNGLWIVQGPVGYKADINLLKQHMAPENREFLDILGTRGILRFDLGEIEVTPSREGLSYSKKTLAAVEALLDEGRATLKVKIQAQVDALGDNWETASTLNSNDVLRRMASITKVSFEAEGYYRSGSYYYLDLEKIANLEGLVDDKADTKVNGIPSLGYDAKWDETDGESEPVADEEEEENDSNFAELLNLQFRLYTQERTGRTRRSLKWCQQGVGRNAKADHTLRVLVRDTTDKPVARVRAYMAGMNSNYQVYVLQNRVAGPVTADELAAIQERIGESFTFAYMSEVELPERERDTSRSGYKIPTAYQYVRNGSQHNSADWLRMADKLKEFNGAYYVTVHRHRTNAYAMDSLVFEMADAGLLDKPIFAIREKDAAKLVGNPDWTPVREKAKELVESVKNNRTMQNARRLDDCYNVSIDCMDARISEVLAKACKAGEVTVGSPLHRLFRLNVSLEKAKARARRRGYNSIIKNALRWGGTVVESDSLEAALEHRANKLKAPVLAKYPLLGLLTGGGNRYNGYSSATDEQVEHVIAYINANTGA